MKHKIIIGLILLCQVSIVLAASSNKFMPAPEKLSQHVYAWIGPLDAPSKANHGYRMNMGVVIGRKAVAVIDTGYTEGMAKQMLAEIRKLTNLPIIYAINTNSQPHRFMGNEVFRAAGAKVVAHKDSASRMASKGGQFAGNIERILELKTDSVTVPGKPDVLLESDMEVDLGGVTIVIKPYGAGHTPAQLVVLVKQDNIVFSGDILYSGRLLAVLDDSKILEWLKAYKKLDEFGNARFVPGHGQPAKLKAFDFPTYQYLQLLNTHMSKSIDEGVSIQDAINSIDQSRYQKLVNFKELAGRNASWAYIEREKAFFE